jgi:hypothetical protein
MIVACVRTGTRYGFEYVTRLRNMVARHLKAKHTMFCLTDQSERCDGVAFVDIGVIGLEGWWGKMVLFEPMWRGMDKVIYLDLDTVIINDISPLTNVPGEFAICERFMVHRCRYDSSVMVIGGGRASFIWTAFERRLEELLARHSRDGDKACIEELYPTAQLLQHLLPKDFFCSSHVITMGGMPKQASIITFGGTTKPHNCLIPWVKEAWA